jgi:hexulose-6-phosphate isomerase
MRKGISIWAFPDNWELEQSFNLAAKANFETIELAYAANGPINPQTTSTEINKIRKKADESGLKIETLASGIFWSVNLLSDDQDERKSSHQHVRKMLEIASEFEADTILVVPGFIGPFEAGAPQIKNYMGAYDRAVNDFKLLAADAGRLGVSIGIENVWNKFLTSPVEMRNFIDEIDNDFVGSYFDVGNVLRTGYPEQWIRILNKRIKAVHFKDFKVNVGTLNGFVDLLEGDVDFPEVITALKEVGYQGPCTAELFTRSPFPETLILKAGVDMTAIFGF